MIGIIAAMNEEMELIKEKLNNSYTEVVCGTRFYGGTIDSKFVVLTVCGVGKVNAGMAATLLIDHFECDLIINTGIAGGLLGVKTEDIVLAKKIVYHDVDVSNFGYQIGQVPGLPASFIPAISRTIMVKKSLNQAGLTFKEATIYSGDCFVEHFDQLAKFTLEEPSITEMEGAAIAQVCTKSSVDFIVLRYVSDLVDKPGQIADYQAFETKMANASSKICLKILNNLE